MFLLSFIDATVEARLLDSWLVVAFAAVVAVKVTICSSTLSSFCNRNRLSLMLVRLLRAAE